MNYMIVKRGRKAKVGQRQQQKDVKQLRQHLDLMCRGDDDRMTSCVLSLARHFNLKVSSMSEFKMVQENFIYELELKSSRKANAAAQMINRVAGQRIVTSMSSFYRRMRETREVPIVLDSTAVGYSDVRHRLDLLANCRDSSAPSRQLRISSDLGGGCLKTSVAFADSQSVHAVQIIHAVVVKKESYAVMSAQVFSVYAEVKAWCLDHNIQLFACSDLKMLALLLGHAGQSASYPCVWCTLKKPQFHSKNVMMPVPSHYLRTEATSLQYAQEFQRWAVRHPHATKEEHHVQSKQCKSIENIPLRSIHLHNYAPAPMHVFMGIVNDIIKYEFKPTFGAETISQILYDRRVYFDRHQQHALSGNAVKLFLNSADSILLSIHSVCKTTFSLNFVRRYSKFLKNLLALYSLCMRIAELSDFDVNDFANCCRKYVRYRESCMRLMHNDKPWFRNLTPKEHALLSHFEAFMLSHRSIGRFSEQSHESVHHSFNVAAEQFKSEHEFVNKLPYILRSVNEKHLWRSNPNV